jgi:hypothetical protein
MDTASLRQHIDRIVHTQSSVFAAFISMYGFSCARCGWCCRENFKIRIAKDISRPSNTISVFPGDIRRISEGDTKEEALKNIKEAIQLVLEVSLEQARSYTEVFRVEVASA